MAQTYTPISDAPITTNFNANSANDFYSNPNDLSVQYTQGLPEAQTQFNDLVAAYQYLQDPNNQAALDQAEYAGYSQYVLGQLQGDLKEQQNLVNLDQAQTQQSNNAAIYQIVSQNPTSLTPDQIAQVQSILPNVNVNGLQGGDNNINSPLVAIAEAMGINTNMGGNYTPSNYANFVQSSILPGIQQNLLQQNQTLQTNTLNPAQNSVLQDFTLYSPDYGHSEQVLQNYYGIDANGNPIPGVNGQVQTSVAAANQDLYQTAYNLKNNINALASNYGVANSGERQNALGKVSDTAAQQAGSNYQQAANQALKNISAYNNDVQGDQSNQNALKVQATNNGLTSLFGNSAQSAINAYNAGTKTQDQSNMSNAENQLQSQQANSSLLNSLFGQAGNAVGGAVGQAVGSLI